MAAALRPRRHELGAPASRFVGRAADLAALGRLFDEGRRLVSVWGTAGMGKTRLAQEFALAHVAAHPDETAWICELEDARDLKGFCGAVARAPRARQPRAGDRARRGGARCVGGGGARGALPRHVARTDALAGRGQLRA